MFRTMRRHNQEQPREECIRILQTEKRGVLAVLGDEGYPYAVPLNFYYDEVENKIYLHGAKEGHKLDAIRRCEKVCFTVWNQGFLKEGDWAYYVTSVVVFARAELITDPEVTREKVRAIGLKYYPSAEDVDMLLQKTADRLQLISLQIDSMTGKLVHEK
ncbi:MAG: pyridoxamine 5'-phosphate oxidase family protein [Clostridia bacterium]|nr:pyridoxamine 5'-phosphate oxidase family protein [Clostridia bacterium]MBQ6001069.1 pyridoxamine 5'-phosphate oxidase family protein [Clostridia bacterium]